jgi:hypothetical protein
MTFEESYATTVAEFALFHAGEPDDHVAAALEATRANIVADLIDMFPNTDVNLRALVDRFIQAIVEQKAEIERDVKPRRPCHPWDRRGPSAQSCRSP